MRVLLFDADVPQSRYLSRIWTPFSVRTGMLSTVDRLRRSDPGVQLFYFHPVAEYEKLASRNLGVLSVRAHLAPEIEPASTVRIEDIAHLCDGSISSEELSASSLIRSLGKNIISDFQSLLPSGVLTAQRSKLEIVGSASDVFIHKSAEILPNCVFDVRDGPVSIAANVKVSPFTYIKGPATVCSEAYVDNCRITGPAVIGRKCRVGGEIEASIISDFSNKHHEGFLGHSIVGSWVNIGALATTSDLKNNYGAVRLSTPSSFLAKHGSLAEVSTGELKFGSIISDCVKIGITTQLKTGSVVDIGSSLFSSEIAKYTPPFSWGNKGQKYDLEKFLADCATIFKRRGK